MSAKEDVLNRVRIKCRNIGIDGQQEQQLIGELTLILAQYDIAKQTTELAVLDDSEEKLIQKFLVTKKLKGCTNATLKFYAGELRRAQQDTNKKILELNVDDIRLMIANMELKRNVSRTSCKNRLRTLSSYYEFLQDEEVVHANPVKKFGDYKLAKRQKEAFSEMELEKIRRVVKTKKEKAILELLLSTGCRVSELVGIKKQEIKGEEILVHGKGQKDRTVIMNARARLAVDEYIDSQGETARNSKWLFPRREYAKACKNPEDHMDKGAVELMCRKWGKQTGVKAYPHKFRRTCATMALRHGMDLIYVSKMLGHESTETTQIYLDLEVETMKEQHRKYVT